METKYIDKHTGNITIIKKIKHQNDKDTTSIKVMHIDKFLLIYCDG